MICLRLPAEKNLKNNRASLGFTVCCLESITKVVNFSDVQSKLK